MNDEYQTRQFFNMRPETTIKLKRIIKEEIRSVLEEQDPSQSALYAIAKEMGVEPTSGPSKNKFREKDYEVGYKYYAGDDYEWDTVTVTAKSPEEAVAKVKNREVSGIPRTASDIAIIK
jgi:hypothetical protein